MIKAKAVLDGTAFFFIALDRNRILLRKDDGA
jgi:hypothetical protein